MKVTIFILMFGFSFTTFGQILILKPGLYQVTSKITIDGNVMDYSANMKKVMAEQAKALTPEMLKQMKSMNIQMPTMPDPNNIQTCLTAKDLSLESIEKTKNEKSCSYKTTSRTSKEINITFSCADGTKYSSDIKVLNGKKYTSRTVTKNKKDKKQQTRELVSEGQWISSQCTKESIEQSKGIFNPSNLTTGK